MLRKRRTILALFSAAVLLALVGCAGLQSNYGQPVPTVYKASLTGLKNMNMSVTKAKADSAGAKIEAKRADGTDVNIGLTSTGPDTTAANIKVGLMGNKDAEQAISDYISAQLGEPQCQVGRGGAGAQHMAPQAAPELK